MHGNTVGRHGRTTGARGARVRSHGRVRRTFGVRRAALTLILCVAALLLSPVNAYADTGLGEYLNNPSGATSVAYEYLTGDSWDDISHEGNSAPATALSYASTTGDYPRFAAFVDSLYHDSFNAVLWYSRLEGIAFLNACTSAREDIARCLREHPLDGSAPPNGTLGSENGGFDLKITTWPGKSVTDSSGDVYWSTGIDPNLRYLPEFQIKLTSVAKSFIRANYNKHLLCDLTKSVNGSKYSYYLRILALDDTLFDIIPQKSTYNRGYEEIELVNKFSVSTKDGTVKTYQEYSVYSREVSANQAPWEATFDRNEAGNVQRSAVAMSINSTSSTRIGYNNGEGIQTDYEPTVSEPVTPTPPDPDEPSNDAPNNVVVVPTVFDTSDIVEAIEILDGDLVAAFNNQNAYLQDLFQYLNDDLANYFYTLDSDLVQAVRWLRQEIVNELLDVISELEDGFSDVVDALQGVNDDMDYFFYRIELQLNNLYSRLGQILSKMGSGGGGNTSSRPDPSDDGDGFLDWLLGLFQTGLEDLLETLNLTGLLSKFNLLRQKFPFSIPWDIAAIIALFVHEPVTPVIDIPYPTIAINGVNYQVLHIDFTSWQLLGQASRDGTFILFAFGLMLRTKSLLDGEKVS